MKDNEIEKNEDYICSTKEEIRQTKQKAYDRLKELAFGYDYKEERCSYDKRGNVVRKFAVTHHKPPALKAMEKLLELLQVEDTRIAAENSYLMDEEEIASQLFRARSNMFELISRREKTETDDEETDEERDAEKESNVLFSLLKAGPEGESPAEPTE
ncbi:MAG: hypothetical protein LBH47_03505 [Christensenellaceae bacterium]|jgi:phage I-like protein|nr:hypothetical protein [Christensenellaceae bacterium]